MNLLNKKFTKFFFISLILNIVSDLENVNFWGIDDGIEKENYSTLGINIDVIIDSIAYDTDTNTKLILGKTSNSESYFYLVENGINKKIVKNTFNIENIESSLIKFQNLIYFYSKSYLKVLCINDSSNIKDFEKTRNEINMAFEEKFKDKSSFEK